MIRSGGPVERRPALTFLETTKEFDMERDALMPGRSHRARMGRLASAHLLGALTRSV